jgi:hypothetical protein
VLHEFSQAVVLLALGRAKQYAVHSSASRRYDIFIAITDHYGFVWRATHFLERRK